MGFTPMEAIVMATRDSATIAGINTGVIKTDISADFMILGANPLENIANTICGGDEDGTTCCRGTRYRRLQFDCDFRTHVLSGRKCSCTGTGEIHGGRSIP
jgi:hypothetical protein